ncbi:MAG: hypothetical protein K5920_09435 [Bacteroidales bacterium]|nr:hypothetical protein [Bacteroidales bacterium]
MTPLEKWQVEDMENTLRLVANYMNAKMRDSCLARNVMLAWNWLYDSLNDIPMDVTSKNGVMYRMRVGQTPGDGQKRFVPDQEKKKKICAECAKWEPGPMWMASDGKHGVFIECKGWCLLKKNKRKRWNYNPACEDGFEKKERNGFIYCGNGEPTEEDLENITELTEELIRDDGNIKGFRAFR